MPLSLPEKDSNKIIAFCINLDRRPDRWASVQQEWRKFSNKSENLIRVSGVDTGSLAGCGASHQLCVDHAARNKMPYIVVLEDDIMFRENAGEIWWNHMSALENVQKCDIFRPALSGALGISQIADKVLQIKDGSGLFFTVYFASSYDVVLSWKPKLCHIDRWLSANAKITNLTALPFVAQTIDGQSDIRNEATKDEQYINKTENSLAKFLKK